MIKNLPIFIGLRYLRSKRREKFVSFVSGFSLCAMALGVAALIIVLSVMNGFDQEIKSRLLKVVPHVSVVKSDGFSSDQLKNIKATIINDTEVYDLIPLVESFIMLSSKDRKIGVNVRGVNPTWSTTALLKESMLSGYVEELAAGQFNIIIGSQIARKMDIFIGDQIQITLPKVSVTPAGIFPRIKRVTVSGIFEVGAQVDGSVVFMHPNDIQKLLRLGDKFQGFQVSLADPYKAEAWVENRAAIAFPEYRWRSWMSSMETLFKAMSMEKVVVSILLSVIIAVAAFNIIASLALMVGDKRKDIAVIRTMGADSRLVTKIFIVQGLAVSASGIAIGTLFGSLFAYFVGDIIGAIEKLSGMYLFDPSIYLINVLPSKILISDILSVVSGALIVSFLATLYPAWRAGKILPAEALRYDQ
jgi:lipoprotein-releasing system permease protein|tara:strand:- start:3388 stop:4635 length:1248 start_codon:yes stop_codon:yes gene_type:complete